MLIGIDASRANKKEKTGVEWYAWHVIEELKKSLPPDVRVVLYSDVPLAGALALLPSTWESRVLSWPPKRFWTQIRLSWEMLVRRPDVLFIPAHVFPIIRPKKTVMTVHDVAAARFPSSFNWFERRYSLWSAKYAVRNLWKIITPSQFTKTELLKLESRITNQESRIVVVPHGVDPRYKAIHDAAAIDAVLNTYNIQRPFLLSVGRLEEKKNTAHIVRSFARWLDGIPNSRPKIQLVLIGKPGHGYEDVREAIAQSAWKQNIRLLGWMDPNDIVCLMNAAEVFLFPSLYEGFGLPVLEAFACGTPVIAGRGSSLEEIGGDAVSLVDPKDPDEIVRALYRLRNEPAFRETLVRKGFERVKFFSWELAGQKTKDALLA